MVKPIAILVLLLAASLAALPADADAVRDYRLHCQGCHLSEGQGMAGKVPNMRGEMAKFLSVPGGREFLIRVPGVANSRLSNQETAELMNWMLSAFDSAHLPENFTPYTAEEVAPLRRDPLRDVRARRQELIAAMKEGGSDKDETP